MLDLRCAMCFPVLFVVGLILYKRLPVARPPGLSLASFSAAPWHCVRIALCSLSPSLAEPLVLLPFSGSFHLFCNYRYLSPSKMPSNSIYHWLLSSLWQRHFRKSTLHPITLFISLLFILSPRVAQLLPLHRGRRERRVE